MKPINSTLKNKLKKDAWTIDENAAPKLEVLVTRPRMAITDSNYFTTEVIRELPNLEDIAVAGRRMNLQEHPDRIFDVHIQDGIVRTAVRDYPDELEKGWRDGIEIEAGKRVGIAFNGEWKRYDNRWILITEEHPFIFWTDKSNVLKTQIWQNNDTKIILAGNVIEFACIRAWKSTAIGNDDNGVLVVYIKNDGKVYYRTFAEQENGEFIWEHEKEIPTTFTAKTINLFITNDYRTGIILEDNTGEIHYKITDRNWAGMGVQDENINIELDFDIALTPINKRKFKSQESININLNFLSRPAYTKKDNMIYHVENIELGGDFGKIILVKTQHDIVHSSVEDWLLIDAEGTEKHALKYEDSYLGREHRIVFNNFNNLKSPVTLKYLSKSGININGQQYPVMEHTFYLKNLAPYTPVIPSARNEGSTKIILEFTENPELNIEKLKESIKIESLGFEDTRKISYVKDAHEISSIEVEANKLMINLTQKTRLKRAKEVYILYDEMIGGILNYESFKMTVMPTDIELLIDPYAEEKISIDTLFEIKFLKTNKKLAFHCDEIVNISLNFDINFIDVDDINP